MTRPSSRTQVKKHPAAWVAQQGLQKAKRNRVDAPVHRRPVRRSGSTRQARSASLVAKTSTPRLQAPVAFVALVLDHARSCPPSRCLRPGRPRRSGCPGEPSQPPGHQRSETSFMVRAQDHGAGSRRPRRSPARPVDQIAKIQVLLRGARSGASPARPRCLRNCCPDGESPTGRPRTDRADRCDRRHSVRATSSPGRRTVSHRAPAPGSGPARPRPDGGCGSIRRPGPRAGAASQSSGRLSGNLKYDRIRRCPRGHVHRVLRLTLPVTTRSRRRHRQSVMAGKQGQADGLAVVLLGFGQQGRELGRLRRGRPDGGAAE